MIFLFSVEDTKDKLQQYQTTTKMPKNKKSTRTVLRVQKEHTLTRIQPKDQAELKEKMPSLFDNAPAGWAEKNVYIFKWD